MKDDPAPLNRYAYDQVAAQFARANADLSPEMQASARQMLGRLAPGDRLLDVGCGAGRDLAWMEAQAGPRGPIFIGADLSRGMLAEAHANCSAGLSLADMRWLGFAAGSFRAVWCMAALLHLPRAAAPLALAEMARVLAPGGYLYLSVQKGSGEGWEVSPYQPPVERFFTRYALEEMAALLAAARIAILSSGETIGHRHWLWFDCQKESA